MSNKTIYQALRAAGLTKEGACGLMGNMQAESSMRSNIAQRGMTHMTDEAYTSAANLGQLDFIHDSVGYGLCQWTYYSRKSNLLNYARQKGVSVGDEAMQVQFCLKELKTEYRSVWKTLTESDDLYQCTSKVCTDYERPAENNISVRYQFAREFYNEFANMVVEDNTDISSQLLNPPSNIGVNPSIQVGSVDYTSRFFDWKIGLIQFVMQADGYWGDVTGEKSQEFYDALGQYLKDMQITQ